MLKRSLPFLLVFLLTSSTCLAQQAEPTPRPILLDPRDFRLGQVGRFPVRKHVWYKVEQVTGKDEMLICGIFQALSSEGPVDTLHGDPFWLQGVSTKGVVDGKKIDLTMTLEVKGTKRYKTTDGGSKTVFLLAPASKELAAKVEDELKKLESDDAKALAAKMRETAAANKLFAAQRLLESNKKSAAARKHLQEIIKDYPDTKAAPEAQSLLRRLPR